MQDLNAVSLIGRLVADPDLRQTQGGTDVLSVRVAFNTSRKNNSTGEWEDVGNFINVTVWGNQAATCNKFLSKGKRVAIQGRLQSREWKTDDGDKRSIVEVVAERVQFIEPKSDDAPKSTAKVDTPPPVSDDDIPF